MHPLSAAIELTTKKEKTDMRLLGLALAVAAIVSSPASANLKTGNSFNELHNFLASGKQTMVVFEASLCQSKESASGQTVPAGILGGFFIHGFMERNGQEIRFADEHLTVGPDGAAKLEIIQYRVASDGNGFVKVTSLSPATYATNSVQEFQCQLGSGLRFLSSGS
jgi:hypothetical protein